MYRWFEQYYTISKSSFKVLLGDPLIFVLNLFLLFTTLLIASLPGFTFGEQLQLVRDESLALTMLCGCLAAALGASKLLTDDIRGGMVPIIMSRPVSGSAFIFGKWTGLLGVLAVFCVSASTACLWATRITNHEMFMEPLGVIVFILTIVLVLLFMTIKHYLFRGAFFLQTTLVLCGGLLAVFLIMNFWGYNGKMPAVYGELVDWKTAYAFFFIFIALSIFAAVMICFSVFMDHSMLLGAGVVIFLFGLLCRYFVSFVPFSYLRSLLLTCLPDWQIFWISDKLGETVAVPLQYLGGCVFHALGQVLCMLIIASVLFKRREISGSI